MLLENMYVLFMFWIYLPTIRTKPCDYNFLNEEKVQKQLKFPSKIISITDKKNQQILISLCGKLQNLQNGCDPNSAACILNSEGKVVVPNAAESFEIADTDTETMLKSINGPNCESGTYTIYIYLILNPTANKPESINSTKCEYRISIVHPKISQKCTLRLSNDNLINLQPLKYIKDVKVNLGQDIAVLSFCRPTTSCNDSSLSGCIIQQNSISPIGKLETQHINFNNNNNEISIVSSYSKKVKTVVHLKCTWDVDIGSAIKSLKKNNFIIESKYGCHKFPMSPVFQDNEHFIYNMSNLNKPKGWRVMNSNGNLLINIFGPLFTPLSKNCTDIYSQICLNNDGKDLNYGSIPTLSINKDMVISIDLLYGSKCPNDLSKTLSTKIEFKCSFEEKGPMLQDIQDDCSYKIIWETPEACPRNRADKCDYVENKELGPDCNNVDLSKCTIFNDNAVYNLTALAKMDSNYVIKNGSFEYYINICRSLFITEDTYLCRSGGVCIQNKSEPNLKKRFHVIGDDVAKLTIRNGLVLNYSANICPASFDKTIETIIYFECSETNEGPKFYNRSDCIYEFTWKTIEACPRKLEKLTSTDNCNNKNQNGKILFNYKKDFSLVDNQNNIYSFNFCHENYSLTINNVTSNFKAEMKLIYELDQYRLEYILSTSLCKENEINKLRVHLSCDKVLNNEHILPLETKNCTLNIVLKTSEVCEYEKSSIRNDLYIHKDTVIEKLEPHLMNCSIISENGGDFNLNTLSQLKIISKNNITYKVGIDRSDTQCKSFVCKNNKPIGTLLETCPHMGFSGSQIKMNFQYSPCEHGFFVTDIAFNCSKTYEPPKVLNESECSVALSIVDKRYCRFFLNQTGKWSQGGVITIIAGLVVLSCISLIGILWILRKVYHKREFVRLLGPKEHTKIYMKDTQL